MSRVPYTIFPTTLLNINMGKYSYIVLTALNIAKKSIPINWKSKKKSEQLEWC